MQANNNEGLQMPNISFIILYFVVSLFFVNIAYWLASDSDKIKSKGYEPEEVVLYSSLFGLFWPIALILVAFKVLDNLSNRQQ
jgi:hypothetical protein